MLSLTVVTPEKKIFTDKIVDQVTIPGSSGEMQILPGHSPVMSTLKTGILKFRTKETSKEEYIALSWGYVEVFPGGVNVLAETAETTQEIDLDRAIKAQQLAEEKLRSSTLSDQERDKYTFKYERALIRQQVARMKDKQ